MEMEDLEGNWAGGDASEDEAAAAELRERRTSKSALKRQKSSAKRRRLAAGAADEEDAAEAGGLPELAAARLSTAWEAHGKAEKLSPLELQELAPRAEWFASVPHTAAVGKLPGASKEVAALRSPSEGPQLVLLCLSAQRAFAVLEEVLASWGLKKEHVAVLAQHGGGRKSDQVKRQAAQLKGQLALAIATPSRLLRLADEGHWKASSARLILLDLAMDCKKYNILTLADPRRDTFAVLKKYVLPEVRAGKLHLGFCGSASSVGAPPKEGKHASAMKSMKKKGGKEAQPAEAMKSMKKKGGKEAESAEAMKPKKSKGGNFAGKGSKVKKKQRG